MVTGIASGACLVRLDGGSGEDVAALLSSELAGRQKSDLAVGDHVLVERRGDTHRVTAVLPRRSLLARADPHDPRRRRAIAANIDAVVVVVAARRHRCTRGYRPLSRGRGTVGSETVLVVNKTDLLDEQRKARAAGASAAVPLARHAGAALQRRPRRRHGSGARGAGREDGRVRRPERRGQVVAAQRAGRRGRRQDRSRARRRRPRPPHHDGLGAVRPARWHPGDRHAGHPPVQRRRRRRRPRSRPGSRRSRRSPRSAASATARTCTSPAAPSAAPSPTARSRAAGTGATSSCSAATATARPSPASGPTRAAVRPETLPADRSAGRVCAKGQRGSSVRRPFAVRPVSARRPRSAGRAGAARQ